MKPEYPKELLPSVDFLPDLNVDELLYDNASLNVVRQYLGEVRCSEKGVPIVTDDMWPSSNRIIGLSMNLLGGLYEVGKHLPFLPKSSRAAMSWDGSNVDLTSYGDEDYSFDADAVGIYLPVSDIQNHPFPYNRIFSSEDEKDKFETIAEDTQNKFGLALEKAAVGIFTRKDVPVETYALTKIIHKPVMLNYWHVTLEALPIGDVNLIEDRDAPRTKRLSKLIRKYLSSIASLVQPVFYIIQPEHYLGAV